jgi:hypothetical protein
VRGLKIAISPTTIRAKKQMRAMLPEMAPTVAAVPPRIEVAVQRPNAMIRMAARIAVSLARLIVHLQVYGRRRLRFFDDRVKRDDEKR